MWTVTVFLPFNFLQTWTKNFNAFFSKFGVREISLLSFSDETPDPHAIEDHSCRSFILEWNLHRRLQPPPRMRTCTCVLERVHSCTCVAPPQYIIVMPSRDTHHLFELPKRRKRSKFNHSHLMNCSQLTEIFAKPAIWPKLVMPGLN